MFILHVRVGICFVARKIIEASLLKRAKETKGRDTKPVFLSSHFLVIVRIFFDSSSRCFLTLFFIALSNIISVILLISGVAASQAIINF